MKKLTSILVTTVLATAIGNVYAAKDDQCPDVWTIRNSGSRFTHAVKMPAGPGNQTPKANYWAITAEPFDYNDMYWQTIYIGDVNGATDPQTAVNIGQNDFNYSVMMTKPESSVFGTGIQCQYSPDTNRYAIYVLNDIVAGFKKFS